MAITDLIPFLNSISGRAGQFVFYKRQDKICIRSYVIGNNPNTALQKVFRKRFARAVKSWQNMSENEKYKYIRKARNLNMSGYNLFISAYMKERFTSASGPDMAQISLNKPYSVSYQSMIPSVSYSQKPADNEIDTPTALPG